LHRSQKLIGFLWNLLEHDTDNCVSKEDYSAFLRRVVRCMVPSVSAPEVLSIADEDSVRDTSSHHGVLSYSQFFDAVFEIGTLWCASSTPSASDLRTFLSALRLSVSGLLMPGDHSSVLVPFPQSAEEIAMLMKVHGRAVLDAVPCLQQEEVV
jgi:hypothetical protein